MLEQGWSLDVLHKVFLSFWGKFLHYGYSAWLEQALYFWRHTCRCERSYVRSGEREVTWHWPLSMLLS